MSVHSDLLSKLLISRGLTDSEAVDKFLKPDYDRDTHDPSLMKDADKAAARLIDAIETGEKVAIYSDYDCDGIPGAAMFHDLFRRIGYQNFVTYIPHRHNQGFGLHEEAVEELAAQGVKLIITIDCGISDREAVARANELGVEVIVTDHHEPPADLPPAIAIIDPKQADCQYPDKNLCGTGVAYKLIQAILKKNRFGLKDGHEKWLLDLVGIATMSDMVPLVGENRVFASYGLQVLRKSPRKGLQRLLSKLRINQTHLTEDDIAFMITPRINAASRMGVPKDAFNLLVADDEVSADQCADHLDKINTERKSIVGVLVKEVKKLVTDRHGSNIPSVIVLGNPEWRPSLLGLAANSCAEEFRRPVFLWGRDGVGGIKGSCRSDGVANVVEIMRGAPTGTFGEFGGHKMSGGFGVPGDAIHYLETRLVEAADRLRTAPVTVADKPAFDHELGIDEVTPRLFDELNQLAPFGTGNPKPVFLFRNVRPSAVRIFGKGNEHVELVFNKSNGIKVPAISFFGVAEEWASKVQPDQKIDLIANIEKSMFRNRPEIRLRVVDVIYS